jgi:hypothetical protein
MYRMKAVFRALIDVPGAEEHSSGLTKIHPGKNRVCKQPFGADDITQGQSIELAVASTASGMNREQYGP